MGVDYSKDPTRHVCQVTFRAKCDLIAFVWAQTASLLACYQIMGEGNLSEV